MILYIYFVIFSQIFLSNSQCIAGKNFCSKCNPITRLCIKCEKDIYSPDSNGGCKNSKKCQLGKNYCIECLEDGNLCKECDIGYFSDENGGCSTTDNCEISYKGECLKCKDNFVLIGAKNYYQSINDYPKICKSLKSEDLQNCKTISYERGFCLDCKDGYFFSSSDKKCIKEQNCEKSAFGKCLYCNYGYYLNKIQQKCIKAEIDIFLNCKISNDGSKCDECIDDYYLDQKGKCVYSNFCADGLNYNCNKCIEGYYLTTYGGICTTEENCYSGRKDLGICTQCNTNYCIDFKDGKCKSNQEDNDLKYCVEADGICKECYYGKYLGQDQKCSNSRYCLQSNKGICIKCQNNYYLGLDNKCTNAEHCIYSDDYFSCIECETNFYLDKNDNKCKLAEGKFENCKIGYGDKHCQKCREGFYINQRNNLCYSNEEQNEFYKCEISNGEFCIQCIYQYYLGILDHKCSKIQYCDLIENSERCLICSDTYCLDSKNGSCVDNDLIHDLDKKFYFRCNKTNVESTACEFCLQGYELRDGLCFDEQHCSERRDDGNCNRCKKFDDEYYEQCISEVFGCIEGYYDSYCLECNNLTDIGECTKCMNGYHFDYDYKCIEND